MVSAAWIVLVWMCWIQGNRSQLRVIETTPRTIPVQLHTGNNQTIDAFVEVDVFGSDVKAVTQSFCNAHNVTSGFCALLYEHISEYIANERRVLGQPLPTRSQLRYQSAIKSESERFSHPELFLNFSEILGCEQSVLNFLKRRWADRPMQRLGFLHSCQLGDAQDTRVVERLLLQIHTSGLIEVLDSVVVLNYGAVIAQSVKDRFSDKVEWVQVYHDVHYFEVPTLRILRSAAKHLSATQPNTDPHILYLHTKGVSYKEMLPSVQDWINVLMHFLVDRYTACLGLLQSEEFDIVGILFRTEPYVHLSGNFWWATGSYLSNRPELRYEDSSKYEAEIWLLRQSNARMFLLHNSNVNHYDDIYPRECYFPNRRNDSEACGGPLRDRRKYLELPL